MKFKTTITRTSSVKSDARLMQAQGIFELPPGEKQTLRWEIDLDLPEQWNVGAIVGASGSGKSTIARELARQLGTKLIEGRDENGNLIEPFAWDRNKAVASHTTLPIKQWLECLSRVGFSSPPAWCRPYQVLSNGQQFRANLARAIAEGIQAAASDRAKQETPPPVFFDEFASLVHDQVAAIASAAVSKSIRKLGRQFVAVTWRTDILDALEPDWVIFVNDDQTVRLEMNENRSQATGLNVDSNGEPRGLVRPGGNRRWQRPAIKIRIVRVNHAAWDRFKGHHYLASSLHHSAKCFVGFVGDHPAAFTAVLSFPHPSHPSWREHRTVCLPDFQGVGIGNAMSEAIGAMFAATGKRFTSVTSHPAMIMHRAKSPKWRMIRKPGLMHSSGNGNNPAGTGMAKTTAIDRITAGFEYAGPLDREGAKRMGLISSLVA